MALLQVQGAFQGVQNPATARVQQEVFEGQAKVGGVALIPSALELHRTSRFRAGQRGVEMLRVKCLKVDNSI